jgi:hypothetical protein
MIRPLIKTIHVGCRALGLDQDTRRDLQLAATGKASLTEMSDGELARVVDALKARGFKPSNGKTRPAAARGDVRFCHVLWGKLYGAGAVDKRGALGLNGFIRARFEKAWGSVPIDVDQMRDPAQIATVAEALKGMCKRAGIVLEERR